MSDVCKADCSIADAYAYKKVTLPLTGFYVQYDIAVPASTFAAIIAGEPPGSMYTALMGAIASGGGATPGTNLDAPECGSALGDAAGLTSPASLTNDQGSAFVDDVFPADVWNTLVMNYDGATVNFLLNGVLVFTEPLGGTPANFVVVGGWIADHLPGEVYYFRNVKVGTTPGGTDLFADDFSSGDFSAWGGTHGAVSVVSDPFPPPVVTNARSLRNEWEWVVTGPGTGTKTFLNRLATSVQILFTLNAPAVWTADAPSDNPEVNIPVEGGSAGFGDPFVSYNDRLLYGFRREGGSPPWKCRFAGVLQIIQDEAASDEPVSHLTAYDPWQWLNSLPVVNSDHSLLGKNGIRYGNNGNAIALDVLTNAMNAILASNPSNPDYIDRVHGHFDTTESIDITFQQGCSVGEAWTQLTQTGTMDIILTPVYDPHGRPGTLVVLNIYSQAGSAKPSVVFAWDKFPRNLTAISRLLDGTQMENVGQYYLGNVPVTVEADVASIAQYGQYWAQKSFPTPGSPGAIELLALADVVLRRKGKRTLTIDPTPELSPDPFTEYYLGDQVPVWAGRPQAGGGFSFREELTPGVVTSGGAWSNPQRIYAIPISLEADQVETVTQLLLTDPNE